MVQILELFGGVGAPRCALQNLGIPTKSIDFVEIDQQCVDSYNAMFAKELPYKTQSVVNFSLQPDLLWHGSPCQDMSCAGWQGKATGPERINHGAGADKGSGTRSSLMWETVRIISELGVWKPRYVVWENVENLLNAYNRRNFDAYLKEMESMGYVNSYAVLDGREFGIPQARQRVFTVSVLGGPAFDFDSVERRPMRPLIEFLEPDEDVSDVYNVTQPSILEAIGATGTIRRATVLDPQNANTFAYTITTRMDRTPTQVLRRPNGQYRYLTERECWRLQGFSDQMFEAARSVHTKNGKWYNCLYKQAGNSIVIPICEALSTQILRDPEISGEYQLSLAIEYESIRYGGGGHFRRHEGA